MTIAGVVALACGAGAVGTGLKAARLWYLASKVEIERPWKDGETPSKDPSIRQARWTAAILKASSTSSRLNASAAVWTAIATGFTAAQALAGIFASGIP